MLAALINECESENLNKKRDIFAESFISMLLHVQPWEIKLKTILFKN